MVVAVAAAIAAINVELATVMALSWSRATGDVAGSDSAVACSIESNPARVIRCTHV
jgi:hypothetical protein